MKTLGQRLLHAMALRKMNQPQLAKAASTPREPVSQQVVAYLIGDRQKSSKHLPAIAKALRVRIEWLAKGEGEMDAPPTAQLVPEIDFVAAGKWREVADPYPIGAADNWVAVNSPVGAHAFALRVVGDSMLPMYAERDVIIIEPDRAAQPGDLVIAKLDDKEVATFKQYRLRSERPKIVELRALNPEWPYPSEFLDDKARGHIVGVVVEHHRYPRAR